MLATQIKIGLRITHTQTYMCAYTDPEIRIVERTGQFWVYRLAICMYFQRRWITSYQYAEEITDSRRNVDGCMIWIYRSFRPEGVLRKDWWRHYLHTKYILKFHWGVLSEILWLSIFFINWLSDKKFRKKFMRKNGFHAFNIISL